MSCYNILFKMYNFQQKMRHTSKQTLGKCDTYREKKQTTETIFEGTQIMDFLANRDFKESK